MAAGEIVKENLCEGSLASLNGTNIGRSVLTSYPTEKKQNMRRRPKREKTAPVSPLYSPPIEGFHAPCNNCQLLLQQPTEPQLEESRSPYIASNESKAVIAPEHMEGGLNFLKLHRDLDKRGQL